MGQLKVMHTMSGWQATQEHKHFSKLLIEEVPTELVHEQRRENVVQPTALNVWPVIMSG